MYTDEQKKLNKLFELFNVNAECCGITRDGSIVNSYIRLYPPTKLLKLNSILNEIGIALKSFSKPEIEILPGKDILRIKSLCNLPGKENLCDNYFYNTHIDTSMNFILGRKINGKELITDFSKNPHMLISGTTGSGKSTLIHTIIANSIKNKINLLIIDPKRIEFSPYSSFDNVSVGSTTNDLLKYLDFLISEMEQRFYILERNIGVKTFLFGKILLIIDEIADLFINDYSGILEDKIILLAQKSRAVGIHCILSTQRPSCDIISGNIKANFPGRIACKTASRVDSRIIMDKSGAELLIGNGDAIINNYENSYERFQVFYSDANSNIEWLNSFEDSIS